METEQEREKAIIFPNASEVICTKDGKYEQYLERRNGKIIKVVMRLRREDNNR